MPRSPVKSTIISEIILSYLHDLYLAKESGKALSDSDRANITSRKNLAQYVFTQSKTPVHEANLSSVADDTDAVAVSTDTVLSVIDKLTKNNQIIKQNGLYEYVPPIDELTRLHPLLKVAADIEITPLPTEGLAFFRVQKKS